MPCSASSYHALPGKLGHLGGSSGPPVAGRLDNPPQALTKKSHNICQLRAGQIRNSARIPRKPRSIGGGRWRGGGVQNGQKTLHIPHVLEKKKVMDSMICAPRESERERERGRIRARGGVLRASLLTVMKKRESEREREEKEMKVMFSDSRTSNLKFPRKCS